METTSEHQPRQSQQMKVSLAPQLEPSRVKRCPEIRGRMSQKLGSSMASYGHLTLFSRSIWFLVVVLVFLAVHKDSQCLRISSIEIPPAIWNGSQTTLECNYQLEPGDGQLYYVTWYKDFVQFYRFKPATIPDQSQTTTTSSGFASDQNSQFHQETPTAPASEKQSFELAGIQLDLSRSNATHVHLKQASEGTFRCEVTADSPTFATVSAERQMKVYVLPKRKLGLVDNSLQVAASVTSQHHQQQQQQQQPAGRPNIYQLNDLLNFTCLSGPARPAARLVWLLNEQPVEPFLAESPASGYNDTTNRQTARSNGDQQTQQLAESRSDLALRLQPGHLRHLRLRPTQQRSLYSPLKVTCLAQFSVEFSSESSLLISGGKTTPARRRKSQKQPPPPPPSPQPQAQPQAQAASWRQVLEQSQPNLRRRLELDPTMRTNQELEQQSQWEFEADSSLFRWPAASLRHSQPHRPTRPDFGDLLPPPSGPEPNPQPSETNRRAPAPSTRHVVVYANRQLRDQAEQIERLTRRSGANRLEPPHIEATAIKISALTTSGTQTDSDPLADTAATSSRTSVDELPEEPETHHQEEEEPSDSLDGKDYELNELVSFTCSQQQPTDSPSAAGERPLYSARLKWLLNDLELASNLDLVNAYEPQRGFYFDERQSLVSKQQRMTRNRSAHPRRLQATSSSQDMQKVVQRSLLIEFSSQLFRLKELNLKCRLAVEQPLIEFESSQVVYLAGVAAAATATAASTASTSPSPFIQANDQQDLAGGGSLPATTAQYRPSSVYNLNTKHRGGTSAGASTSRLQHGDLYSQARYQQGSNVIKLRHQSQSGRGGFSSSSSAASSAPQVGESPAKIDLLGASLALASSWLMLVQPWPERL